MIDQLRSLGIEKGKPFSPDSKTKEILESGAREADAWLDARLERLLSPPYFEATHWALPASSEVVEEVVDGVSNDFAKPDSYPVDGRGITSSIASIGIKHLEAGQLYLMTVMDKDGNALDEASSYHLAVPAKVPVTSTGRRRHTTEPPTPSSAAWSDSVVPRRTLTFRSIATAPSICTSDREITTARRRIGYPQAARDNSRSSFASTDRSSRCWRKHGSCPTSKRLPPRGEVRTEQRLPVTSRPRTSFAPRATSILAASSKTAASASSITVASLPPSKIKPSSGSTAIRSTQRLYLISTPAR